jgi:hypothetical protein
MASREDLQDWVTAALKELGGRASIANIARQIWTSHEMELRSSGELFYTWQYDMRWACTKLRALGRIRSADTSKRGEWVLVDA